MKTIKFNRMQDERSKILLCAFTFMSFINQDLGIQLVKNLTIIILLVKIIQCWVLLKWHGIADRTQSLFVYSLKLP